MPWLDLNNRLTRRSSWELIFLFFTLFLGYFSKQNSEEVSKYSFSFGYSSNLYFLFIDFLITFHSIHPTSFFHFYSKKHPSTPIKCTYSTFKKAHLLNHHSSLTSTILTPIYTPFFSKLFLMIKYLFQPIYILSTT